MIPTPSDIRPALRRVLAFALLAGSSGVWATTPCATLSPALERLGADYLLLGEDAPSAIGDLESFAAEGQEPLHLANRRASPTFSTRYGAPLSTGWTASACAAAVRERRFAKCAGGSISNSSNA